MVEPWAIYKHCNFWRPRWPWRCSDTVNWRPKTVSVLAFYFLLHSKLIQNKSQTQILSLERGSCGSPASPPHWLPPCVEAFLIVTFNHYNSISNRNYTAIQGETEKKKEKWAILKWALIQIEFLHFRLETKCNKRKVCVKISHQPDHLWMWFIISKPDSSRSCVPFISIRLKWNADFSHTIKGLKLKIIKW